MKFPKALNLAWSQIALALILGTLLSYAPATGMSEPFHHIGIGLLVAAVVTTFWQFREFAEYLEKYAQAVLVHDEHLKKLNLPALMTLRARADAAILNSVVTNEHFQRKALGEWLDDMLYAKLLPGNTAGSGIYRDSFDEDICLEYPTLREALIEVGVDTEGIPPADLSQLVLKVTSTATYKAVSPRLKDSNYEYYVVPFSGRGANLPHFPLDRRVSVEVGIAENLAKPIVLSFVDEPLGGITFKGEPERLPFRNGECDVWMRSVEYRSPAREPYVLNTMSTLTRNVNVHLYRTGPGPKLTLY